MEALWNKIDLERPPNTTFYTDTKKIDVQQMLTCLRKAIKMLKSQELLHIEATVLSRLLYRMKRKFRHDKGVKEMGKVNRALLNYLALDLSKEYDHFKNFIEIEEDEVCLPSRQMLQYILVRTQGFAKLMIRIEETAKRAAEFLKQRMGIGHAWSLAIISFAVVSRIWTIARYLTQKSCVWYNNLFKYLENLKIIGLPWIPENQELPEDLKCWLSVPWIHKNINITPTNREWKNTMFKLIEPQQLDLEIDPISIVLDESANVHKISDNTIDFGEIIDRKMFESNPSVHESANSKKSKKKKKKKMKITTDMTMDVDA